MTFSGFGLPDELVALRDLVGRFVREQLRPAEDALGPEATAIPPAVLTGLRQRARSLGLWCLDAPAEYGGAGLSAFELVVVLEEACKHKFCFPHAGAGSFGQSPPVVLYQGGPDIINRFVRPTIEHGWTSFTAIAEESGGSDPAHAIRTAAKQDGDHYVLSGRKMWITNAERADYGVVYARTDAGISAFIVETSRPGVSTSRIPVIRNHAPTELILDDVRIPAGNLVGQEGQGLTLAASWLVRGRLTYAARAIGIAEEAVRLAVEWMGTRSTFGAPLATRQGLQWSIADAAVEISAGRWLTWQAAWKADTGQDARLEAAMAKLYCTEVGFRVVDSVMQILGAMGMAREVPLESWFRDLRVARVVEGTSEMLRSQIARQVIGPAAKAKN
ncbi:MAG TPA: acyl-CoA dehydrogenase family protein [Streptosporangiaceae bacterium]|nr:acyl-CoA dehydrogenase family protein [Streptosporangiaceae bacterium]